MLQVVTPCLCVQQKLCSHCLCALCICADEQNLCVASDVPSPCDPGLTNSGIVPGIAFDSLLNAMHKALHQSCSMLSVQVATTRYQVFGKTESCRMCDPSFRERFIDT